jgi:hypothetical protein
VLAGAETVSRAAMRRSRCKASAGSPESGFSHLLGPLKLGTQIGHRDSRQTDDIHRSPRAQVDRQVGNGLVIGSLDDGDEIALPDRTLQITRGLR